MIVTVYTSFHTELHKTRRSFESSGRDFDTFLSYSRNHGWANVAQDDIALNQLNTLVYYYALEVYGRNEIKMWLKTNQDKSVLDRLTASDLAFTVLVYDNYHPKWINDIETAREDEQLKDDDDAEESVVIGRKRKRSNNARPVLRYTKPANVRKKYLESGWTNEGLRHFKQLHLSFQKLMKHDDAWQVCKESWDNFITNMKQVDDYCWIPQYFEQDCLGDGEDEEDSIAAADEEKFDFVLEDDVKLGTIHVPPVPSAETD